MPACERLDGRAGFPPCTAHRPLQQQAVQSVPEWRLQVIPWFRMEGTLVLLCSSDTKHRCPWCPDHPNLSKH